MNAVRERRDTAAALVSAIWDRLASVLGATTTAVVMRRAAVGFAARNHEHAVRHRLAVVREDLEYRLVIPPSWEQAEPDAIGALKEFVEQELAPLLDELTGPIGTRLLIDEVPELGEHGILADWSGSG